MRGPQRWSPEAAAPRPPNGAEVPAEAGTALASCTSSRGCQANFSAAGTSYFLGTDTPGKLLLSGQRAAKADPLQNAGLFPSSLARGMDFTGSQTLLPTHFAKSGSACGQKLHASCLLPSLFL